MSFGEKSYSVKFEFWCHFSFSDILATGWQMSNFCWFWFQIWHQLIIFHFSFFLLGRGGGWSLTRFVLVAISNLKIIITMLLFGTDFPPKYIGCKIQCLHAFLLANIKLCFLGELTFCCCNITVILNLDLLMPVSKYLSKDKYPSNPWLKSST